MQTESALHLRRQDSYAIALTFAVADGDLVVAEVHVFDPKPDAFHESKPCSVEEFGHESVVATQLRDNFLGFVPCEDNWNLGRPFPARST